MRKRQVINFDSEVKFVCGVIAWEKDCGMMAMNYTCCCGNRNMWQLSWFEEFVIEKKLDKLSSVIRNERRMKNLVNYRCKNFKL
jgi:hypothetical protein